MIGNIVVLLIVAAMVAGASYKLYKDKKNNVKCSGCPSCTHNGSCASYHK